ncbi:MOSC domain-containing protein [Pestalotiopsis sp. NC0098]|nr:MOSC domain-containing protein [Pestalotiopsis sp. NC0098]
MSTLDALGKLDSGAVFLLCVTMLAFLVPVVIILPPVGPSKSDALLQTHSLAAVAPARSGLKTQYSAPAHDARPGKAPHVQALVVYPIKSCRGVELAKARVLPQGLQFDRLFTFAQLKSQFPVPVDEVDGDDEEAEKGRHTWTFITQRQFARLATVEVELWLPDEMKLRKQSIAQTSEAFLILRFPWRARGWRGLMDTAAAKLTRGPRAVAEVEVLLPVDFPTPEAAKARGYTYEDVTVWGDRVTALNLGADLPEELRLYLGVSNKLGLFRIDPANLRENNHGNAPKKDDIGWQPVSAFQDGYPLHIQNISSVQAFSKEVPKDSDLKQLSVMRFRPNIIVSGAPAYDEDEWQKVRLDPGTSGLYNPALLDISCRTTRCRLPNVDPDTGDRHPRQPDKSLRALRNVDPGAPRTGCLGVQACPLFAETLAEEDREGWVGVGMDVVVEERGEHFYQD